MRLDLEIIEIKAAVDALQLKAQLSGTTADKIVAQVRAQQEAEEKANAVPEEPEKKQD